MTTTPGQPRFDDARHPNYYELLEVDPQAARSEIIHAYDRARAAFAPDSLATYTLLSPEEALLMSGRLETAFRVLVDAHERDLYDQWLEALACEEDVPPQAAEGREPPPARPSAPVHEIPAITGDQQVNEILASANLCDGSVIARVRVARGMTLQQISAATKISQMNLQCIEDDNFASLPPSVFLRGFLQQVARCLSVDAHAVADGYMTRFAHWQATTRGGEPGF